VKARTAHDRFGLTHIDMVRGGRGISKGRFSRRFFKK
jgi:hypothetical protein